MMLREAPSTIRPQPAFAAFAAAVLMSLLGAASVRAEKNLGRIMPLGDSITKGAPAGAYRDPLCTLLKESGCTFQFVGSLTENPTAALAAAGQDHHEGHSGMGMAWIDDHLKEFFAANPPDRVLLAIGANDIGGAAAPELRARMEKLVEDMFALRPQVQLYLASVTPQTGPAMARIREFNSLIPALVAAQQAKGRGVFYVSMDALDLKDLEDNVHPNVSGSLKMARAWHAALATPAAAPAPPDPMAELDRCNVVWDSPSADSTGSMPLGNGDIGLNAWVETNGDLVFFIAKTDAWSDAGRLVKLGQVRVRLMPSLPASPFRQELQLRKGQMIVRAGGPDGLVTLRLWVDANRPVIHLEGESSRDTEAQVSLVLWRTQDRDWQHDNSADGVTGGGVPILEGADTLLPPGADRIVWFHRNERTIYPLAMKTQGLESLMGLFADPILHRTFGGCIRGEGLVRAEAGPATQSLRTARPARRLSVVIPVLSAQTETPEQWLARLDAIDASERQGDAQETWREHCRWWEAFWRRSWIFVHTPDDDAASTPERIAARWKDRDDQQLMGTKGWNNRPDRDLAISTGPAGAVLNGGYARQRFISAAAGRGAYPIKFNGSIFTVNTRDPGSLAEADHRSHGPCYWFQNTRLSYWPMLASGDFDTMQPLFGMYRAVLPLCTARTRLYYNHEGAFFPETMYPWGTYPCHQYGWHHKGPPGFLDDNVHIRYYWSGGLELTAMMLDYYEATLDGAFLRDTLLPIASGVAAFFDQHWKRDGQGTIHFEPACSLEDVHDAVNPMPEIAGLNYVLPRLLALPPDATTAPQRAAWARTLADLPPVPMEKGADGQPVLRVAEVIRDQQHDELPQLYAVFPYRLYAFDSAHRDIGRRTFEQFVPAEVHDEYPYAGRVGAWRQSPIQAAFLGETGKAARMIVSNFSAHHKGSRFPAFWGPGHDYMPDQCHGGVSLMTLQSMLLQSSGRKIYLFPAWPKDWDVQFKLHALYRTTVEAELRNGKVTSLKVTPASRAEDVVMMLGPAGR